MSNLTDLEFKLMDLLAHCEFNTTNGATPKSHDDVHTYLWVDERAASLGLSGQACGGVFTSLQNKGMIGVSKPCKDDPDGGVWFTEAGFTAWKEMK